MTLEQRIQRLIDLKYAAPEDGPRRRFYERQLTGLRYRYEEAGPIMEDLDPAEWGGPVRPHAASAVIDPRPVQLHCKTGPQTETE